MIKVLAVVVACVGTVFPALASSPSLAGGTASGATGTTVTIPITFTAGSKPVAAFQWSISLPQGWSIASASAGSATTNAAKKIEVNKSRGLLIVFGVNQKTIDTGSVANIQINIPASAGSGVYTLPITNAIFSAGNGATVNGGNSTDASVTVGSGG